MRAAALAALLALAGCVGQVLPIGPAADVVTYRGEVYPFRIVINEPVAGAPGLTGSAARIVAPDAPTATAVYLAQCGGPATGPAVLDRGTGEWVVPGPCAG